MTRRAGPLGAPIYATPSARSRLVGTVSAGQEVQGDVVLGEELHNERRWIHVEGYVSVIRLVDIPDLPPPAARAHRRKKRS